MLQIINQTNPSLSLRLCHVLKVHVALWFSLDNLTMLNGHAIQENFRCAKVFRFRTGLLFKPFSSKMIFGKLEVIFVLSAVVMEINHSNRTGVYEFATTTFSTWMNGNFLFTNLSVNAQTCKTSHQPHCLIICRSFCVWFVSRIQ